MTDRSRYLARVALFTALAYVLALASVYIPNVSLIFIVVFTGGVIYGTRAGLVIGAMGEFLWTVFNPYGMAPVITTLAQITGMMIVGLWGGLFHRTRFITTVTVGGTAVMAGAGLACGLCFQLVVNGVEAWVYGPFWEYLSAGLVFSLITIISNALIFPLCYPLMVRLSIREQRP